MPYSLSHLNMSYNSGISGEGWKKFSYPLLEAFGETLVVLNVSYCAMYGEKTIHLMEAIRIYKN